MAQLPKDLEIKLSEPIEDIYNDVIDRLISNICKHLGTGNAFRTADWEVKKLSELGRLTEENARIIQEAVKKVPSEVREALSKASLIALEDLEEAIEKAIASGAIERAPTDSVKLLLDQLIDQSLDKLNLVNTTLIESSRDAYLNAISTTVFNETAAMNITNQLAVATTLATETRNQALKKAIQQMLDNGLYGFVDRAGRHWSPEAYASMLMRTTSHNAAVDSIKARQEDYDSDIFQVSVHSGARPLCFPYQGNFYSWEGKQGTFTDGNGVRRSYKPISSTSYGQAAGLFGVNCRHYPIPQIPKVTIPQNRKAENKKENDKLYQETQEQRAIERSIREAKREVEAYKSAGLVDEAKEAQRKVSDRQAVMREFIKRTGLTRRYDREYIK